jgi:hypothetical protein
MLEERQASARIVAVLGDANKLTARRSTAARSAFNLHAFLQERVGESVALCSGLLAVGGSEWLRSRDWVGWFALELAND